MKYRYIILGILTLCSSVLTASSVHGARLYLEPAGGTMIAGCTKTVLVQIDHDGDQSNTTQLYYSDNLTGGGDSSVINEGSLYSDYFTPPNIPPGLDALVGYTFGTVSGNSQTFARLLLRSNTIGKVVTVDIDFDEEADITSNIYNSGVNYLTEVVGGSYTVVDGFCDTVQPNVINRIPVQNEPNHPVDGNITFDLTDNDSGVAIDTLQVTITQELDTIVYTFTSDQLSYTEFGTFDYNITIDPDESFTPQTLVNVAVQVADRAGNIRNVSWSFNGLTCEALGCGGASITQCNDGVDNDGDGQIDLADTGCTDLGDNNEFIVSATNDCSDGVDNDGDGSIDNADSDCRSESGSGGSTVTEFVTSTVTTTVGGSNTEVNVPDCRDGRDNDGDGFIDFPADTGCEDADDEDEYEPTPEAVLQTDDLLYFLADRTIQTYATTGRTVVALANNSLGVDIRIDAITRPLESVALHTDAGVTTMLYDNSTGRYRADIRLPSTIGFSDAYVRVTYTDGSIESIPFRLSIQPYGTIKAFTSGESTPVNQATVILEVYENGTYRTVDQMQATNGRYAFIVPNGTYRVRTTADGYVDDSSARFSVNTHIVNHPVTLRKQVQLLDPEVPLEEKVTYAVASTKEQVEKIQETFDDPVVEAQARQTVAPAAAVVTTAALVPALSTLGLLNYLRYIFFQPLLLLGRKKRKGWGYVYNTLTRTPLDLAQVRLIDNKTNRVVQSRVTDMNGRYIFFADPGVYRIEVEKNRFTFPTTLLQGEREDGPYVDIYHGEPIRVTGDHTVIAANIPVDPITAEKPPKRIYLEKLMRRVQSWLSVLGIVAGSIAAIISPGVLTIGLLVAQVVVLAIFYFISRPKVPKNWGIVYDGHDNKLLPQVIVRLFSKKFDKLVSTDYTDKKGRYAFLVNPNEYYVTYQKPGYTDGRKDVTLKKDTDIISESIGLTKKSDTPDT